MELGSLSRLAKATGKARTITNGLYTPKFHRSSWAFLLLMENNFSGSLKRSGGHSPVKATLPYRSVICGAKPSLNRYRLQRNKNRENYRKKLGLISASARQELITVSSDAWLSTFDTFSQTCLCNRHAAFLLHMGLLKTTTARCSALPNTNPLAFQASADPGQPLPPPHCAISCFCRLRFMACGLCIHSAQDWNELLKHCACTSFSTGNCY